MKKYINTSNYYLSTTTSTIPSVIADKNEWHFDVSDVTVDGVTLPLKGYYWVDVDFGDVSKREIFRVYKREGYTLYFDDRISPNWAVAHASGASVGLRDFSQLLNSLSTNTDNFWEIEKRDDLKVLVRGWIVYSAGKANAKTGKHILEDTEFTLPINKTTYIVLSLDEIAYSFSAIEEEYLTDEWQYPIAKITTGATMISEIEDLRGTVVGWWNMRSEIYDPEWKRKELYLMDNMEQSEDWLHMFVSQAQIDLWNSYQETKQPLLKSWENIVTISGKSIIDVTAWPDGNIPLDTILTAGWETAKSADWANTFIFWVNSENIPLTENSFIVFSDSGTMLTEGWSKPNDYTYDDTTHTISFNEALADNEHAIIWLMYNNTDSVVWVWSATITLTSWNSVIDSFNVNQDEDKSIDIWAAANDSTITVKQWGISDQTFTTNQDTASNINLQWIIDVTQEEYNNLPESKLTDNNWYFIYEE